MCALQPSQRLESWKEIATYLKKSISTVQRYEREEGLPIHRHEHHSLASVYAYTNELDAWRDSRKTPRAGNSTLPPVNLGHAAPPATLVSRRLWIGSAIVAGAAVCGVGLVQPRRHGLVLRGLYVSGVSERLPTLSADARYLLYQEMDPGGTRFRLLDRNTERDTILATFPASTLVYQSRLSPDAKLLAYLARREGNLWEVKVRDRRGGSARGIATLDGIGLDWAPDSQTLVMTSQPREGGPVAVQAVHQLWGDLRIISHPPATSWGDIEVAASPDGTHLAVVRYQSRGDGDVWLLSWDGRLERRLTTLHTWINGLTFSADAKEIIFSPVLTHRCRLYRVRIDGTRIKEIPTPGVQNPINPKTAGATLVFEDRVLTSRVYRAQLREQTVEGKQLLSPITAQGEYPVHSPDGSLLAWSQPDGIWALLRGAAPRRVIALSQDKRELAVAPGNRHLAVTVKDGTQWHVYIIDMVKGREERLTTEDANEGRAVWSAVGSYIYWRSDRGGEPRYYRRLWPAVAKAPEPVSPLAVAGAPSTDDRLFYYLDSDQRAPLRECTIGATTPPRLISHIPPMKPLQWTIQSSHILYGDSRASGTETPVYRAALHGGIPKLLFHLPVAPEDFTGLTLTPDHTEIAWSLAERQEDIWVFDNFQ